MAGSLRLSLVAVIVGWVKNYYDCGYFIMDFNDFIVDHCVFPGR
jgi:hypothetical protein